MVLFGSVARGESDPADVDMAIADRPDMTLHVLALLQDLYQLTEYEDFDVLGEAPTTYKSSFALAAKAGLIDADLASRLAPSVGLRNVSAHEYIDIDLRIVANALEPARRDYGAYVTAASRWLSAH